VRARSGYCEGRGLDGRGPTGLAWEANPEASVEKNGSRHCKKNNDDVCVVFKWL